MLRRLFVLALGLVCISMAEAQETRRRPPPTPEHPCDVVQPTTFTVRPNDIVRVAWCQLPIDSEGATIPVGAMQFLIIDADTRMVILDVGTPMPTGSISPVTGQYYYVSPPGQWPTDIHLAVVSIYRGVVIPSLPIFVDVKGPGGKKR